LSVLLDTHMWLWWLSGSPRITPRESKALDTLAVRDLPFIAAISLWEAQMLVSHGRLTLNEPFDPWIHRMTATDTIRVLPIDADVVSSLHALSTSFHGDSADRLIIATARTHALALATRDGRIRRARLATIWKP
jgi:PIN domain nuclease of toxin-antitoxin system